MKRNAKFDLVCLLLCFIMVACAMLSACNNEIVSNSSDELVDVKMRAIAVYSSAFPGPIVLVVNPKENLAQVFCYVSVDPLDGNKEEVQLCDEKMYRYGYEDKFTFHADVEGAHCVAKQVAEDSNATTIRWLPFVGSANGWVEIYEDRYLEAVIKENGSIVGYVLCRYHHVRETDWVLQTLLSVEFPKVNGRYQNITEEYLQQLAKSVM